MLTLFLDHDGVMVTDRRLSISRNNIWDEMPFDANCVLILNRLFLARPFNIVISSDWRHRHTLESMQEWYLTNNVIAPVIGMTGHDKSFQAHQLEQARTKEIFQYIIDNNIHEYVVLDDLDLSELINFVQCLSHVRGLAYKPTVTKLYEILQISQTRLNSF